MQSLKSLSDADTSWWLDWYGSDMTDILTLDTGQISTTLTREEGEKKGEGTRSGGTNTASTCMGGNLNLDAA